MNRSKQDERLEIEKCIKEHWKNRTETENDTPGNDIADFTHFFAGAMTDKLMEKCSKLGYNLILEWGMREPTGPLKSMKELKETSNKIKLLIVGDGPDLKNYQDYCLKNDIKDNCIFTGKVPWENIVDYYLIADVFATASKTETQGLTVIEAFAASLPVLAIKDESFTGTVINNLNGYIFKNRREYKKSIISLYNDRELVNSLSKQARNSAERHSAKYFAEHILDVYKIAIKNQAKPKKNFFEKITNYIEGGKK